MKLPRDVAGHQLASALAVLGYEPTRQRGSHTHLVTKRGGAEHHIVVPDHRPLKPGMLSRLLKNVAEHHGMTREELIEKLRL